MLQHCVLKSQDNMFSGHTHIHTHRGSEVNLTFLLHLIAGDVNFAGPCITGIVSLEI